MALPGWHLFLFIAYLRPFLCEHPLASASLVCSADLLRGNASLLFLLSASLSFIPEAQPSLPSCLWRGPAADNGHDVQIEVLLTSRWSLFSTHLLQMIDQLVCVLAGVGEVDIRIVWNAVWTPERMSARVRATLSLPISTSSCHCGHAVSQATTAPDAPQPGKGPHAVRQRRLSL